MAVADLIGAAVGVILLVIVAYLLVGSTISTAEIVTNAQKTAIMQEEMQMRTDFTIVGATITSDPSGFNCTINNTGNEIISDFTHMDIIVYDSSSRNYQLYTYSKTGDPGTWKIVNKGNDIIHTNELDPGESYIIQVTTSGISPHWFQITTGNGVYASEFL
jgi:flagellar protein FlaF